MSDSELGSFLRSRREAMKPADVGLPAGSRRRTPGLRRAELATLAGISVEYLTRLEQGRDRHPSTQVLAALSDALRLSPAERTHLLRLSKAVSGACLYADQLARSVRPTVQALLDRFEPAPAVLLNRIGDVLAATSGYERLARPVGVFGAEPPNLLRFVFADPRARTVYPEWERIADEQVAILRTESFRTDEPVTALAGELSVIAGVPFTSRWEGAPHLPTPAGVERWVHPEVGELRLAYETLWSASTEGQRLVFYLPDDEATSGALDRLAGRQPGALRALGRPA